MNSEHFEKLLKELNEIDVIELGQITGDIKWFNFELEERTQRITFEQKYKSTFAELDKSAISLDHFLDWIKTGMVVFKNETEKEKCLKILKKIQMLESIQMKDEE